MKLAIIFLAATLAVAMGQVRPKSDCEKHREQAIQMETIMKLIPKCKENGDYEALQCYKDSDFCVCYDKKGHAASPISKSLRKCDCHLRRHEKIKSGHDNPFLPQCEPDGAYKKKQCWDYNKSCWCVDENGNTVGKHHDENDIFTCE